MNFSNYLVVSVLVITLFFSFILFNNNFFEKSVISKNKNESSRTFLQISHAIEEDEDEDKDETNNKNNKSVFNIAAVGD